MVRKFVHLLEQSPLDLREEQEVTQLREEVVTKIRSNQQMEKDLNLMDIKIGLLVKNRISLQVCKFTTVQMFSLFRWSHFFIVCFIKQDVVTHNKKMKNEKNKASKDELTGGDGLGIKGLSKGKRRKLEAYQHLFYLLQVWYWRFMAPGLNSNHSVSGTDFFPVLWLFNEHILMH